MLAGQLLIFFWVISINNKFMDLPLVSVVIPVYNGEKYLCEAIESVLAQTYPQIEIIVVDDGSTDSTVDLLSKYKDKIYLFQKKNGGVASALNLGIKLAHGEFIAWLSHDDVFLPEKIQKQVDFFVNNKVYCACHTNFEIIDSSGKHIRNIYSSSVDSKELPLHFLQSMHINGSTMLIRKKFLYMAGLFREDLLHTQDMDMWLRLSSVGEIGWLDEILIKSRSHLEQGSLNFERQILEEQAFFRDLINKQGPTLFFPDLSEISNYNKRNAIGRKMYGDKLLHFRKWYRFALEQYLLSNKMLPSLTTLLRIMICKLHLVLLGDEKEYLMYIKHSRLLLGFGMCSYARDLSGVMIRHYPLRVDAIIIWLVSWTPRSFYLFFRKVIKGN